jgi:release factor glutamine methyltransferase
MTLIEFKKIFFDALNKIYSREEIDSIFKLLLQEQLGFNAADIVLSYSKKITSQSLKKLANDLQRLQQNEPIQYIIGRTTFFNLDFLVNKQVLIPRPETEELVQWIIDEQKKRPDKTISILDIGTGSGCIAISLSKNIHNCKITAIDVSKEALKIAKKNAKTNNAMVYFLEIDILNTHKLPDKYDIIVSNPPYVLEQEKEHMHNNVLQHEPSLALFVKDSNPLLFYDKISDLSINHLNKSGQLYFEINQSYSKETEKLLKDKGFDDITIKNDFRDNKRMIKATKKV